MLHSGELQVAKALSRDAMRAIFIFFPVTGMIAGAAPEIVGLLFGPQYSGAAPLLSILFVGAGAQAKSPPKSPEEVAALEEAKRLLS